MTSSETHVIVGASLAGAKAAETLRDEGFDGRVVLIGSEGERPYERPPLSKDYLRGEAGRDKVYVHDAGFYADRDIELRLGHMAVSLDPGRGEVGLDDGTRFRYERLLLATGAEPRRLEVPGAELNGVHYLRRVGDSDALRTGLDAGGSAVVVGAGWIGAEVAASARPRGLEVTVLDPLGVPLERVLGTEVGAIYRDIHTDHGVRMLMETGVEAFEGDGRVERVRTTGGRTLDCDFVVVGVGVEPRVRLAAEVGLEVSNGVTVDAHLRTSADGVYAAGDVASAWHPLYGEHIRVEHWANALNQGPAAARSMLGHDAPYERLPYFFSDQYDVGMEYSGYARSWDRVVFRGDPATREFLAFWMVGDRVAAGMSVNVWDVTDAIEHLRAKSFWVHDDMLLVEMHDIFITVEHTLISKGQEDAVRATRQTFQSAMRDEFQGAIEDITGRKVINYDNVMFTHPPSVLEIFVLEPEGDRQPRLEREAKEDEGSQVRPLGGLPDNPDAISA
jgi:3-phenylpropionate/trans-cinnamate dioxygenase ferredoxin reductase component